MTQLRETDDETVLNLQHFGWASLHVFLQTRLKQFFPTYNQDKKSFEIK